MVIGMDSSTYEALARLLKSEPSARVEVTVRAERRRRWQTEDKLRIVRETLAPSVAAKGVAERHGISTGLLYTWRKQMLATDTLRRADERREAPPVEA